MDSQRKNLWGNGTSYGHEILHGTGGKHFRVKYDVKEINLIFFYFLFPKDVSKQNSSFPTYMVEFDQDNWAESWYFGIFHNFCYHFENFEISKRTINLHGNI